MASPLAERLTMQSFSLSRSLSRRWMLLVAVVVIAIAGLAVHRLNGIVASNDVTPPWSYDTTTTKPAVFVNVSAQGDGNSIGCRITIDDAVKGDRSAKTVNAFTYGLDTSG